MCDGGYGGILGVATPRLIERGRGRIGRNDRGAAARKLRFAWTWVAVRFGILRMLRKIGIQLLSGVICAQHLLESTKFLLNLSGCLVALPGDHVEGGGGRQRQRRAGAPDRSDQIP